MKKITLVTVVMLVAILISVGVWYRSKSWEYLDSIGAVYGVSTLYTKKDFENSIKEIKQQFNKNGSLKNYRLESIEYIGDEEMLDYRGSVNSDKSNNSKKQIAYRVVYIAPKNGNQVSNPYDIYRCRWILETEDGINWKVIGNDDTSF